VVRPYDFNPAKNFADPRLEILPKMLGKDPQKRPSMEEVLAVLKNSQPKLPFKLKGRKSNRTKEHNIVLFPARMGIPHKGHIEFITRLLQLGFYVVISLQRSYTITKRDPLPKWLVGKMVVRSLFDLGFTADDFEIIFTPYYETSQEMSMHFGLMPDWEKVIAVASSNPDIPRQFPECAIFDQKTVFGTEGKKYDDLSWGEILRQAVRNNEYQASGVETILTFSEIQQMDAKPEIEFVSGKVRVVLLDHDEKEIQSGQVLKYLSPEQSLQVHLRKQDPVCAIIDLYRKDTLIKLFGTTRSLQYLRTEFESGNETIYFRLT
jgi:hypothetical protein